LQAERFNEVNHGLRREQIRVARVQAINVPLVQVLAACSVALVIYVASSLSRQDLLTPGEFVAFITAMSMVFEPVRRLTNVNATLQRGLAAAESIFALLDERSEAGRLPSAGVKKGFDIHELTAGNRPAPEIEFRGVSYQYPGSDNWALKDFSLKISAGQTIALVGPSGSGKSSILHLLCGFDVPKEGNILIDQRATTDLPVAELRARIALVGQQTLLFDLTVEQNLRLARPEASEQQVIKALQAANAYDFVATLPQGLNTPLGSLGDSLSGGQRQRLSIARAFLKNASILLFDEATSALDKNTESEVIQGLKTLVKGKTTILVSHNPERLLYVDQVVKL